MKKIIMGLLAFISSTSVFAAESSSGCGMGWGGASRQSLISSATRSIVNATFSNTIAMILGTSLCARHSIVKNDAKGIHFAEANMNQLAIEMASENGDLKVHWCQSLDRSKQTLVFFN